MKTNEFSQLKSIILSWDFLFALIIGIACHFIPNSLITLEAARELIQASNSILAVLFSVYFAALAILVSAGDNKFVYFLQKEGFYKFIIRNFRFTLWLLFTALIVSIAFLFWLQLLTNDYYIPDLLPEAYIFLFLYSIFAAITSASDAIRYAQLRGDYLQKINDLNKEEDREQQNKNVSKK